MPAAVGYEKIRRAVRAMGLILALFSAALLAQDPPEMVLYEDLNFSSEFERKSFELYKNGSDDLLRLFAAIDPDVTENIYIEFKNDFQLELDQIRDSRFERQKKDRKVRRIYEHVNSRVLTRYQEKILFPHLFVNGNFNCLTASAYYGFLMDSLGIDYNFRETRDHVHPVAFPQDLRIKIETTDRLAGIQYYDEELQSQFADYLLSSNAIKREEYDAKTAERLFNDYFLPQSSIGMTELAGLHYMNDALYKFDADDYDEALVQISKAYYIYPSEKMLTIFQFVLANVLANKDYTSLDDAQLLVYLSRLPSDRIDIRDVENGFINITQSLLFNNSMETHYDEMYALLEKEMKPGEVHDIISFQYYHLRGRSLVAQYMFTDGLELLLKAYEYKPRNMDLQTVIISALSASLEKMPVREFLQRLESFQEDKPDLAQNGKFVNLMMTSYLLLAEQYFDFEQPARALLNLGKFEKLVEKNPSVSISYDNVSKAYSAAAVYYFKNYQKDTSISFLQRGLEIAPGNYELLFRLRSLVEE